MPVSSGAGRAGGDEDAAADLTAPQGKASVFDRTAAGAQGTAPDLGSAAAEAQGTAPPKRCRVGAVDRIDHLFGCRSLAEWQRKRKERHQSVTEWQREDTVFLARPARPGRRTGASGRPPPAPSAAAARLALCRPAALPVSTAAMSTAE